MAKPNESAERNREQSQRDADLLIGIRRNDIRALREFVQRFELVLRDQARRLGVRKGDRGAVVADFMDDILVKLAQSGAPRYLMSFVVTSFRNHVADIGREAAMRERHAVSLEQSSGSEPVIRASCSEFMLRAALGPDADDTPGSQPGIMLARILFDGCSTQDRQLLVWTAHRVPLRECAAWLGISHDSAKQRLSRLRARLIREGLDHVADLPVSDRDNFIKLLHRAGVKTDDDQTEGSAA